MTKCLSSVIIFNTDTEASLSWLEYLLDMQGVADSSSAVSTKKRESLFALPIFVPYYESRTASFFETVLEFYQSFTMIREIVVPFETKLTFFP